MRSPVGLLGALLGVALLGGCTGDPAAAPPSSPPAPLPARTTVPVPATVQRIPGQPPVVQYGTVDDPQPGVAYEYHLYVHCGVRAARFGGRWWRSSVPSDGSTATNDGSQYITGSMTLVSGTVARFEWDGGSAEFVPVAVEPPPCT